MKFLNILERCGEYNHYPEKHYELPNINIADMIARLTYGRDEAIAMLGRADIVGHIFAGEHNDELPDHFGQIYFELAEACIQYLEQNDEKKFSKVFPMFMSLALLAIDSKFVDPALNVNDEFRLHLISSVINDLASVLGFAILYSNYFDNMKLSEAALDKFKLLIDKTANKQQYLTRMVRLSNSYSFSLSASPRNMIRSKWKMAFEHRARHDGFSDQMGMSGGKSHKNKIVRAFLYSDSDASHLFFAIEALPQLFSPTDFEIDYHITSLARFLDEECDEGSE